MRFNDVVEIKNKKAVQEDKFLDAEALAVIVENHYRGVVTKESDGIFFVGFKNENGWVTQGYKADEIEVIAHG